MFVSSWGLTKERLDPEIALFNSRAINFNYPVEKLATFLSSPPQYGANEAGIPRLNDSEARYVRITDIDEYGNLVSSLGVTAANVEEKYLLSHNDLLFARSGNTVGKSYLHKSSDDSYRHFFAGYMIRFTIDAERINPDYVFAFTQTRAYANWVKAVQRVTGQPNINADEYKSLPIPLPPPNVQNTVVDLLKTSYEGRARKEQEAKRLLESTDSVVLEALGINLPVEEEGGLERRKFFRGFRELNATRLDPFPYQQRRMQAIQAIDEAHLSKKRLHDVFLFRKEVVTQAEGLPYVGLEHIRSNTGEYIGSDVEKETFNSAFRFYKGDILFPKLRPYLNKVHLASFDGVCSTEFYVLTEAKGLEEYLAACLRSRLIVNQTSCLMTGNTLPRLQTSDVENLLLPLPNGAVQKSIGEGVRNVQKQVNQIREEANQTVIQAKQQVERMILGDVA